MMNNTLEKKATSALDSLQREAWMDMPTSQLDGEQKKALREFERMVQAYEDELEKQRRMAEGEVKALEEEILGLVRVFNVELIELHGQAVDTAMLLACAQQQAAALASTLQLVRSTLFMLYALEGLLSPVKKLQY
jgi:hypothetical protein